MTDLLIRNPEACVACALRDSGYPRTIGYGPRDALVAVVGINPGRAVRRGGQFGAFLAPYVLRMPTDHPLAGSARAFRALASSAGLDLRAVYSTNAVKCVTPGNRPPTHVESRTCHESHLAAELADLPNLRAVLAYGRCAGRVLGLSDFGQTATVEGTIARGILLRHPTSVLRKWTTLDREARILRTFLATTAPTALTRGSEPARP